MSKSESDYFRQREKVSVWIVKDGELQVACLPKAEASPGEDLPPGIVPVLDVKNGRTIRCLLPKCYSYSPVKRAAHSSSSHKKSYRTSRSERTNRRPYEDKRSSRKKDAYDSKEFTKLEDEYTEKTERLENEKKFLFDKLDKTYRSALECSRCFSYAIPNPLSCAYNHIICRACADLSHGVCPTKVDRSNHRKCQRNLHGANDLTVKFAKECRFKCPNLGCNELLLYDNYIAHLSRCPHDSILQYQPQKPRSTSPILYDFGGEPILSKTRFKNSSNIIPAGAERDVAVVGKK